MHQENISVVYIPENKGIVYFHQIQHTIRESLAIQGGLPAEIQSKIDGSFNSYLNSEKYQSDFEELYQSLQWSSPDSQKLEMAFQAGLISNIKYSQTNPDLTHTPIPDIIESYNLHCQETAKNLEISPNFSQGKKRNGVLYAIISCPRLYPPDIFNQLCQDIKTNKFVNTAVITSLIEKQTPNIKEAIVQKSKIFHQIMATSIPYNLHLNFDQVRTLVIQHSDPIGFINKKYFSQDIKGQPEKKPSRVNLDSLIRQLSRVVEELISLEGKTIPPNPKNKITSLIEEIEYRAKRIHLN